MLTLKKHIASMTYLLTNGWVLNQYNELEHPDTEMVIDGKMRRFLGKEVVMEPDEDGDLMIVGDFNQYRWPTQALYESDATFSEVGKNVTPITWSKAG